MGRSSSKLMQTPNSPLQELQCQELRRAQQKRKLEKEQKQIAKLQKKHAKRQQKKGRQRKGSCEQSINDSSDRSISAAVSLDRDQQRSSNEPMQSIASSQNMRLEVNREELNRQMINRIQQNLNGNLCAFALNQIAIGQQFFGNYESEIVSISDELLAQENLLNQHLDEQSILLVNPLDAATSKWFHYQRLHGPTKDNRQLLQTPVMYVVFENIDIARANDANYDSISPLCRVDMETEFHQTTPCKEEYLEMLRDIKWKGYVRLKLRDTPKIPKSDEMMTANENTIMDTQNRNHVEIMGYEELYTDVSSGYSSTGGYSIRPQSRTIAPNVKTNRGDDEPIYDYAYIAHLNAQHPLSELQMRSARERVVLDAKVLPESCVSMLASCMDAFLADDSDDDDDDDAEERSDSSDDEASVISDEEIIPDKSTRDHRSAVGRRDQETVLALRLHRQEMERKRVLLQQRYLNSREFMRYFGELIRLKLAPLLGVPQSELESSSYRGSSIYTKQYEIIPAIHVAQNAHHWPDCAFQFRIRDRPIFTHPQTGQQMQWPTRAMIKRIETFGFHVVPVGFAPKRIANPFRELEWRIVFPKAERYLEQHLTGAQVKVYMLAKALVKTFIEPTEAGKGLTFVVDHLRTHLFWECERNYIAWPEEFLGDVLIRFIESFMIRLREKRLADYFVEERNLFESIPEYSLVILYSLLADIIHNPLPHIMIACRYLHPNEMMTLRFPKLNFRKLFDCLTENDMMPLRIMSKQSRCNLLDAATAAAAEEEPTLLIDEGTKGLLGLRQHREKTHGKLRRKTHLMRHNIEVKKQQDMEQRRRSVESISVEFFFGNDLNNATDPRQLNQGVENLRRTNILEIFIDHLLAVGEWALQLHTVHQASICLEQARRLVTLYHNYGCDMSAKDYQTTINGLEDELDSLEKSGVTIEYMSPPILPIRPSMETVRSSPLQLVRELAQRKAAAAAATEELLQITSHSSPRDRPRISVESHPRLNTDDVDHECGSIDEHEMAEAIIECEQRLACVLENETTNEENPENLDIENPTNDEIHSDIVPGKSSITFMDNVMEVHENDTNHQAHKLPPSSPTSILRIKEDQISTKDGSTTSEVVNQLNPIKASSSTISLKGQAKNVAEQLSATLTDKIERSKLLKSLSSSTEKLVVRLQEDEKCEQLREILKQKTLKLRNAFHS